MTSHSDLESSDAYEPAVTIASPKESQSVLAPAKPDDPVDWIEVCLSTLILSSAAIAIVALPFSNLLHSSPWQRSTGFWHSLFAAVSTAIFIYTGTLALPLHRCSVAISRVRRATCASALVALLTVLSGLSAYARYKAPVADAAGVYIQVVTPLMQVGMVWHQLTSLSLFGLSLSTFYCFWVYGDALLEAQPPFLQLRQSICLCLGWILLFGLSNFIVGISLAKVHGL